MFQTITKRINKTNYTIDIVGADKFKVTPTPPDNMKEIFEKAVWQAIISGRPSGPRVRKVRNKGIRRGGIKG